MRSKSEIDTIRNIHYKVLQLESLLAVLNRDTYFLTKMPTHHPDVTNVGCDRSIIRNFKQRLTDMADSEPKNVEWEKKILLQIMQYCNYLYKKLRLNYNLALPK